VRGKVLTYYIRLPMYYTRTMQKQQKNQTLDLCCGWVLTQHESLGSHVQRTYVALGPVVLWPSFCPWPWPWPV